MASNAAMGGTLSKKAKQSMMEDINLRVSLLMNPEWLRQMDESDRFFLSGGKGKSLRDLGWE